MFDGVTIPFGVSDAISTAMGFMSLYGTWILLGVGVVVAIVLIGVLFWVMEQSQRATRAANVMSMLNRGEVRTIDMDWQVGKNGRMEGKEIYGRH